MNYLLIACPAIFFGVVECLDLRNIWRMYKRAELNPSFSPSHPWWIEPLYLVWIVAVIWVSPSTISFLCAQHLFFTVAGVLAWLGISAALHEQPEKRSRHLFSSYAVTSIINILLMGLVLFEAWRLSK